MFVRFVRLERLLICSVNVRLWDLPIEEFNNGGAIREKQYANISIEHNNNYNKNKKYFSAQKRIQYVSVINVRAFSFDVYYKNQLWTAGALSTLV